MAAAGAAILLAAATLADRPAATAPPPSARVETPRGFMARFVPADPVAVRGRYIAVLGDCVACHTAPGRRPFAGGLGLNTPFGTIYSSNLTSDRRAGLGAWTPDQFWRAMRDGVRADGAHLYPALPYPYFTRMTRADSDALLAYFKSVPAVAATPPDNGLPFPFNIRFLIRGWNLFNFRPAAFTPDPKQSAEWNRGAYIVQSLGHCGACHTTKNLLSGDQRGRDYQGAELDYWYAPNLTGSKRTGLASWSVDDIAEYLRTGRGAHANAGGAMADVVMDSTSLMTEADRRAIAVYLKSLSPAPDPEAGSPAQASMRAGEAIYVDACTGCHRMHGEGAGRMFPPLRGSAALQSRNATNALRAILEGVRTAPTPLRPTPIAMPGFAWKLTDRQIADVTTYVRNSWGNRAEPVGEDQVHTLRKRLASVRPNA